MRPNIWMLHSRPTARLPFLRMPAKCPGWHIGHPLMVKSGLIRRRPNHWHAHRKIHCRSISKRFRSAILRPLCQTRTSTHTAFVALADRWSRARVGLMNVMHKLFVMLFAAVSFLGGLSSTHAASIEQSGKINSKPVCPGPSSQQTMRCHALIVTDGNGNPLVHRSTDGAGGHAKKTARQPKKLPIH